MTFKEGLLLYVPLPTIGSNIPINGYQLHSSLSDDLIIYDIC